MRNVEQTVIAGNEETASDASCVRLKPARVHYDDVYVLHAATAELKTLAVGLLAFESVTDHAWRALGRKALRRLEKLVWSLDQDGFHPDDLDARSLRRYAAKLDRYVAQLHAALLQVEGDVPMQESGSFTRDFKKLLDEAAVIRERAALWRLYAHAKGLPKVSA